MWHFWEQLQCVAHSPLIVGMTIAPLFSLHTCIVQIQSVQVNFVRTKRLFNLSAEAIINVRHARLCAMCAIFFLRIKRIPFSCHLVKRFTFLKRVQSRFKMLLEMCFVPVSIVSTEGNANLVAVMPLGKVHVLDVGILFKIYRVVKFLIAKLTRFEKDELKSCTLKKFNSKPDRTKKI